MICRYSSIKIPLLYSKCLSPMEDCAKLRLRQAAVRLVGAAMIRHLNGGAKLKITGRGNGCGVAIVAGVSWSLAMASAV